MGMVFKNIEYMNEGCFENLSGRSVPNSIERAPPPWQLHFDVLYTVYCNLGQFTLKIGECINQLGLKIKAQIVTNPLMKRARCILHVL